MTKFGPAPTPAPLPNEEALEARRAAARQWFESLRDSICAAFEAIEDDYTGPMKNKPAGRFTRKAWQREDAESSPGDANGGGGVMSVMKGRVFEKVGVNVSTVQGKFSADFAKQIPGAELDPSFYATGISLVAHMHSPHVPAVHMNTRYLVTTRNWFGGGADLNPPFPNEEDTRDFHNAFRQACDATDASYYPRFKAWCDEYFFNKHRGRPRGEGGIFYDYLDSGDWQKDFDFTQAVGKAFLDIYPQLVRRHMHDKWTEAERERQLVYRGHYAEFNLVYDRGTLFGLKTGGNIEAILMSLPPEAKWP